MYRIVATKEFTEWFTHQTLRAQVQIDARLERIKDLGHRLSELKWKNGLRIYFSIERDESGNIILILIGGNKNSQKKDIKQARKILSLNTYRG